MKIIPKIYFVNCPETAYEKEVGFILNVENKEYTYGLWSPNGYIYVRKNMGLFRTSITIGHELCHHIVGVLFKDNDRLHKFIDDYLGFYFLYDKTD